LEISVVVPVYIREEKHLAMSVKCIELARAKTKLPYELIIVETCSDYLKDYADVHIYEKERKGITQSFNKGFKCASGDYVVLLTNDVFVSDNWLEVLKDTFKKEGCGIATLASTQFGHKEENKIEEGVWFSLVMVSRPLVSKIGYFDEQFKRVFNDTDYVLRTYEAGYKMYRNFNCVVDHLISATVDAEEEHHRAYPIERILFNEKHKDCKLPIFEKLR
jgi:GT2 family glycosyltransferase